MKRQAKMALDEDSQVVACLQTVTFSTFLATDSTHAYSKYPTNAKGLLPSSPCSVSSISCPELPFVHTLKWFFFKKKKNLKIS